MSNKGINRENLINYVRAMLVEDSSKGPIRFFVLRFFNSRSGDEDIDEWIVRNATSKKILIEVEDLADRIIAVCDDQASGVGGIVKFRLYAYAGEGQTKFVTSRVLTVYAPEPDDDDDESGVDPRMAEKPTEKGREAQRMRHHEAMFKMYQHAMNDLTSKQARMIEDQQTLIDNLAARTIGIISVVENAMTQSKHRELMEQQALNKSKLTGAFIDKVNILLPHLVNKWLGAPVVPMKGESPEVMALRAVFKSVQPEQLPALLSVLNEAQRAPLMALFERLIDEENEEQETAAVKLPSAVPSPKQLKPKSKSATASP